MQSNNIFLLICAIFFILIWLPSNILTEINNKSNDNEYTILIDKLKNITTKEVKITFVENNDILKVGNYIIDNSIYKKHNNLYVVTSYETDKRYTTTKLINNKPVIFGLPSINGTKMDEDNYIFLARQNPIGSNTEYIGNVTYKYNYYAIDKDKSIVLIEGLKEFEKELDMDIYVYEYGPINIVSDNIKKRKQSNNLLLKWVGRCITFILLLIGLICLTYSYMPSNNIFIIINKSFRYMGILSPLILTCILTSIVLVGVNII